MAQTWRSEYFICGHISFTSLGSSIWTSSFTTLENKPTATSC